MPPFRGVNSICGTPRFPMRPADSGVTAFPMNFGCGQMRCARDWKIGGIKAGRPDASANSAAISPAAMGLGPTFPACRGDPGPLSAARSLRETSHSEGAGLPWRALRSDQERFPMTIRVCRANLSDLQSTSGFEFRSGRLRELTSRSSSSLRSRANRNGITAADD